MRVEDHWEDKTTFFVSFLTTDKKIINKSIVLDFGTTEEKAKQIVLSAFNRVQKVLYCEEVENLLSYKNNCQMV
ncbi:hypothetical protein [Carnobacterium maltaromaticum]|uniref:hypothetical protein n=1 Tax=Carnobacterium maltaromaticum TaxID=2751 RepID=UPI0039BEC9EB